MRRVRRKSSHKHSLQTVKFVMGFCWDVGSMPIQVNMLEDCFAFSSGACVVCGVARSHF